LGGTLASGAFAPFGNLGEIFHPLMQHFATFCNTFEGVYQFLAIVAGIRH
jgi:hypothetical protein